MNTTDYFRTALTFATVVDFERHVKGTEGSMVSAINKLSEVTDLDNQDDGIHDYPVFGIQDGSGDRRFAIGIQEPTEQNIIDNTLVLVQYNDSSMETINEMPFDVKGLQMFREAIKSVITAQEETSGFFINY